MSHRVLIRLTCAAAVLAFCGAGSAVASADGPVGKNPKHNVTTNFFPSACSRGHGRSRGCIDAAIRYLDKGRRVEGKPRYQLPRDFVSLSPIDQDLVLTDEDRVLYHLAPVPGLTAQLDRDAEAGARAGEDPTATSFDEYTANWGGGLPNIVFTYGAWMYDDGWGSPNEDCTSPHAPGCWGHRHDVLFKMTGAGGPIAMGAGTHGASYAMLIAEGGPSYHPRFLSYTWAKAKRDGAR